MNDVAKQQPAIPRTIKSWLASDHLKTQVSLALPKHCSVERMMRVTLTTLMRTPKLADCTPESFINCLLSLSALGLEPDGRRAYLIPYGTSCTLVIGYQGLVELAKRSGDVSNIYAQTVCENDTFSYDTGVVHHEIDFRKERGPMFAAYSIVTFKDGSKHSEVMSRREIESIRKRSKAANNGPWVTDFDEMAKKTTFRRASKWITLSPEIADAMEKDADSLPPLNGSLVEEAGPPQVENDTTGEYLPNENVADVSRGTVTVESTPAVTTGTQSSGEKLHTVQESLAEIVTGAGFTFDHFRKWADGIGAISDAMSLTEWSEVPTDVCRRLLRGKTMQSVLKGLSEVKV